MEIKLSFTKVYLACGYTDLRKSIDGLSYLVSQNFKLNPTEPALFLFCGRRRDRIKALLWQDDGFLLMYKRLENGRFQWPRKPQDVLEISEQQYRWLMEGLAIEQPKALKKITTKYRFYIMGPLSRPRSKILRVAVSRIILSSEASKVKLVGNLVA